MYSTSFTLFPLMSPPPPPNTHLCPLFSTADVVFRLFSGSMHSLTDGRRRWLTKLSSAGLVYLHFGHTVLSTISGVYCTYSTIACLRALLLESLQVLNCKMIIAELISTRQIIRDLFSLYEYVRVYVRVSHSQEC